jgi:hypothetical protein
LALCVLAVDHEDVAVADLDPEARREYLTSMATPGEAASVIDAGLTPRTGARMNCPA